jgi:putative hydrolase of the HAD superfamily
MSARRSSLEAPCQNRSVLLLIDLDNTLIDRAAAFKGWAESRFWQPFGQSAVSWVVAADRDGYEPRESLSRQIADRFGVDAGEVLAELRATTLRQVIGRLPEAS